MPYKKHFPIFNTKENKKLIYLDSAGTTQKPRCVIDAEIEFYEKNNANIHRGVYALSERATNLYEQSRAAVANFIHANHLEEIIFTSGTTESINLVAEAFAAIQLQADDEIILSVAEHHSNLVPWQMVCKKTGAKLIILTLTESGEINPAQLQSAITPKTKMLVLSHVSNVLGIINPIKKLTEIAHAKNVAVLIDGAQAVGHIPVDVQALDCDFYAFSAHKMYGPTGVGVLYVKKVWYQKMAPYQTGGGMIQSVTFDKTDFAAPPNKFEAGTPNIAGVVALRAAIEFIQSIGFEKIMAHEQDLLQKMLTLLSTIPAIKIFGDSKNKIGVIAFQFADVHPHDVATILDQKHIAVRAGHHCAMPLMHYLKVPALSRISLGMYNCDDDIAALKNAFKTVSEIFHVNVK